MLLNWFKKRGGARVSALLLLGLVYYFLIPHMAFAIYKPNKENKIDLINLNTPTIEDLIEKDTLIIKLKGINKLLFSIPANDIKTRKLTIKEHTASVLSKANISFKSLKPLTITKMSIVKLKDGQDVFTACKKLSKLSEVEWVEPAYKRYLMQVPPIDPLYDRQWYLKNTGDANVASDLTQRGGFPITLQAGCDVDAENAWNTTTGDSNIVIAVIDTGVDYTHIDLSANMWENPGEIPNNGVDDDGNGYIDDYYGYDFADGDPDPMDDSNEAGHGTHCAGIIGAVWNTKGTAGIAEKVKIMALKVADSNGDLSTVSIVEALEYVALEKQSGINIKAVNLSLGGPLPSNAMKTALSTLSSLGVLAFVAAGNNAYNNDIYMSNFPANYLLPNIITVGATGGNDTPTDFTQYGNITVDIFSPGLDITSTIPSIASDAQSYTDGTYYWAVWSGTSMATPLALGISVLGYASHSTADWRQIKSLFMTTGDAVSALSGLSRTGKRVNANQIVTSALPSDPVIFDISDYYLVAGRSYTIYGYNFGSNVGSVTIAGQNATINSWTNTQISITVPSNLSIISAKTTLTVSASTGSTTVPVMVVKSTGTVSGSLNISTPYPTIMKQAVVNGTVYGIVTSSSLYGLAKFDPNTNNFTVLGTFPDNNMLYTTPVSFNNTLYLVGYQGVYIYDEQNNNLTLVSQFPNTLLGHPLVASDQNYIYVAGGLDITTGFGVNDVYAFDPQNLTWTYITSMPTQRILGASAVIDGKLFLAGGTNHNFDLLNGLSNTCDILDLNSNTWTTINLPVKFILGEIAHDSTNIYIYGTALGIEINQTSLVFYAQKTNLNNWYIYPEKFDFLDGTGLYSWAYQLNDKINLITVDLQNVPNQSFNLYSVSIGSSSGGGGGTPSTGGGGGGGCNITTQSKNTTLQILILFIVTLTTAICFKIVYHRK